jgi:hypothetical protein
MIVILSILSNYYEIKYVESHVDESSWMQKTYFYYLFFIQKDYLNSDWDNLISYDHPHVMDYILGLSMHLGRNKIDNSSGGIYDWLKTSYCDDLELKLIQLNQTKRNNKVEFLISYIESLKPNMKKSEIYQFSESDILFARKVIFSFAVLSMILLIFIIYFITRNFLAALITGLIYINNDIVLPAFQQVLSDSVTSFLIILNIYLMILLFHNHEKIFSKKGKMLSIFIGISLSLAIGTKFYAIFLAFFVFLIYIYKIIQSFYFKQKNTFYWIQSFIIIILTSIILFIILNPMLYFHPFENGQKLVNNRIYAMNIQNLVIDKAITSISQKISVIIKYGIFLGYDFNTIEGIFMIIIFFFLFTLGIWKLLICFLNEYSKCCVGPYTIILLWIVSTFIINSLGIHVIWIRYFIPHVICTVVLFGLGISKAIDIFSERYLKHFS